MRLALVVVDRPDRELTFLHGVRSLDWSKDGHAVITLYLSLHLITHLFAYSFFGRYMALL